MPLFNELAAGSSKLINSASDTVNILERATNAFVYIDTDHRGIHRGQFFETSVQATLSSGGTHNIVLTTPATDYIHYRAEKVVCSADKLTISLYENCSVSGGATVTPYNHNRNNTAVSTVAVVKTANVTADGTLISQSFIGGGSGIGGSRQGAETSQANEWVLALSKNYCVRLSNGSTGSNTVNINNLWYEEDAT